VMNLRSAMASIKGTPTTTSLLAAFKTGSNHQNFMSHPYTCNGKAVAKAASICNDYYLIEQIQGSKPVIANANDWVTSKGYFHGL
jgi:branched-chain amino acid transport system substrate-binding protein